MEIVTRFAPSPTGNMHVGNARIALLNWIFARKYCGKCILRMDDTDLERSEDIYANSLLEDLKWLKIDFDISFYQSTRKNRYKEICQILIQKGVIYPCYETLDELAFKKQELIKKKLPPIYDRSALHLTDKEKLDYIRKGRKPYFRFLLSKKYQEWNDIFKGKLSYDLSHLSDPVVLKGENQFTYLLSSVIDDMDFGVTHILRGEDHITNTAVQIDILQSLKSTIPIFGHIGLLHFGSGKISKRTGGFEIRSIRENFIEPISVNNFLFQSFFPSTKIYLNICEMAKDFDLNHIVHKKLLIDLNDLNSINAKLFANMTFIQIQKRLEELGCSIQFDEHFWVLIKNNVSNILEIEKWYALIYEDFVFSGSIADHERTTLLILMQTLPKILDLDSWDIWLNDVVSSYSIKKQQIFLLLRKVITGCIDGPQLKTICIILGSNEILKRINNCLASSIKK